MTAAKREVMEGVVQFIESILGALGDQRPSADEVQDSIESFRIRLNQFNTDESNPDSRPFMLISKPEDGFPDEALINEVILAADKIGLSDQIKKVRVNDAILAFFSHKARSWFDEYLEGTDLGYTNLLSNGLVMDDFSCVGFYTASKERLAASLVEAKSLLQLTH